MASGVTTQRAPGILAYEDYSLYSSLSEDELMQMAIEQSLMDMHRSAAAQSLQTQTTTTTRSQPAATGEAAEHRRPARANPQAPTAYPPSGPLQPSGTDTALSAFITGNGKQCVSWRRYDGSIFVTEQVYEPNPVATAIMLEDVDTLTKMMKSGKNMTEGDRDGWLPLHEAAYYGKLDILRMLLRAYPGTVDKRTLLEETPLYLATIRQNIDCVQFLLESGAEPDIANKSKETPLYKACEHKNAEIVSLLVRFNADINHRCIQGWAALHESATKDSIEIAEILVQGGAKIEATNIYGVTPLFVAAQSGNVGPLRYLISLGADVNTQASDSATALYEASKNGHDEVVEILLSQNADANKPSKHGWLPLHVAAQCGTYGKKLYYNEVGRTDEQVKIISMLIPVTSRARIKRSGISPLHLAAERDRDDALELLINSGFDVNAMLSHDRSLLYEDRRSTPLYFAISNKNINAIEMLLEAGANPNIDTINPLLVAIRQGCITSMKLLVEHGANIDCYIPTHPTSFPATIMFSMKYLSLLKFLLDLGCDADSCFNCQYGSAPHPVLPTTSSYDVPRQASTPMIVQFCEMVSTPDISRWAGPIIDVLLDYVGNVTLCSKLIAHLDSYEDWAVIKEKSQLPRSLLHLSRLKVRQVLGKERLKHLNTLPIPERMIRYLDYNISMEI
ncbi:ankyrin repeat and SOCS box protein 2-like isoform X1 [Polyodon spathula]|uniref:ankyrin repeat and SOCS box protein 2-like isoform X1 n=1 Tax=Polyodon spathula TaxID=7913 RepID=UPI001B7DCA4C|nr:ankyrin repeat and SOCS box protein 2-like isoform X1 [Polyodon spathula]XP_041132057.1 ankyrin repeat and SOCS box protein 2-like isoform X1 [Polyodon spathula]